MNKSPKTMFAVVSTLVVAAAIILGTAVITTSQVALAQAPSPTPTAPSSGGTSAPTTVQKYWDFFWNTFAQALNTDVAKVKTAFTAAFDATVDQAVKDGLISQTAGDSIKAKLGNTMTQGPAATGGFPFFMGRGFGFGFKGGRGQSYGIQLSLGSAEFAKALNMTEQDLATELKAGKSINDIAKEKNIDAATVKSTVLADLKTQLDAAVASQTITQAQADQIYSNAISKIDTIMSSTETNEPHFKGAPNNPNNNGSSGNSRFGGGNQSGNGL